MIPSPSALLDSLSLRPQGATADELHGFLLRAGIAVEKIDLVRSLDSLHRDGRVSFGLDRRWRISGARASASGNVDTPLTPEAGVLAAVPARFSLHHPDPETEFKKTEANRTPVFPPDRLLAYYEATLRRDARGSVTQTPDRHGLQFMPFCGDGAWWPEEGHVSRIRIRKTDFPASFREALSQAVDAPLAIGWPLAVITKGEDCFLQPVAVMGTERFDSEHSLELNISDQLLSLNIDWLKGHARGSGWGSAEALRDYLLPAGDEGALRVSDLRDFAIRIEEAAASRIAGNLDPRRLVEEVPLSRTALVNASALFLALDGPYTRAAASDLARLQEGSEDALRETAFGIFFNMRQIEAPGVLEPVPILNPVALTENQFDACRSALSIPLTVVTGPPGTGKSQVIVAVITSMLAAGRSVLFASRNHQAIDAVEERFAGLLGKRAILTRALDRTGERSLDFRGAIDAILAEGSASETPDALDIPLEAVGSDDQRRRNALDHSRERARLGMALAEIAERLETVGAAPLGDSARQPGFLSRFLERIFEWFRRKTPPIAAVPDPGSTRANLELARERFMTEFAELAAAVPDPAADDPCELTESISKRMAGLLPRLVEAASKPGPEARIRLRDQQREIKLAIGQASGDMPMELARDVLVYRPIWAVSTLAAPRRIPRLPGLFDLVIFDEASQCDIASAVPLLVRAKRALIVGDPNQLSVIPSLSVSQDRELLGGLDLHHPGIGRFAQSMNSLFDLASTVPGAQQIMLRDQFRSDPGIVGYLNEAFYGMRLRPCCDASRLRRPTDVRPGLHWTDVHGPIVSDGSRGCASEAEAMAITAQIAKLVAQGYSGSVGVIALFHQQARCIERHVRSRITTAERDELSLRVATVDAFQGGERDTILLSLSAGTGMPPGARRFLEGDRRRFNVAISRARAVCHIFGDRTFAETSGIPHLTRLAARTTHDHGRDDSSYGAFESPWEKRLHQAMTGSGLDPRPQYEIAGRRLDFALFGQRGREEIKLDVEVDGRTWHMDPDGGRKPHDRWRDHQLRSLGWTVRRFWVHELRDDMEGCVDLIEQDLGRR